MTKIDRVTEEKEKVSTVSGRSQKKIHQIRLFGTSSIDQSKKYESSDNASKDLVGGAVSGTAYNDEEL